MKEKITPIYEDKNFVAINKPAGLLVHQTAAKGEKTLVDWLLKKYPEIKNIGDPSTSSGQVNLRPGIVHRLDRETSGVILIARNQKYFEYLKNLFSPYGRSPEGRQGSQIKKTYLALVWGKVEPKTGIIKKPIRLKSGTIKRTVWQGKMEKEAITEYKVLKYLKKDFSLLKVMPKTGRTHQIRAHLASIGHPIVGDTLYGKKTNPFNLKRLFLHAESLEFSLPPHQMRIGAEGAINNKSALWCGGLERGRRIKIEAGLPNELKKIVNKRLVVLTFKD